MIRAVFSTYLILIPIYFATRVVGQSTLVAVLRFLPRLSPLTEKSYYVLNLAVRRGAPARGTKYFLMAAPNARKFEDQDCFNPFDR